jgi:citrate synthase
MSLTSGTLEIHDTRTLKNYSIPVTDNVILGSALADITATPDGVAEKPNKQDRLRILDPGYANTAVMESNVTYWYVCLVTLKYHTDPGLQW